MKTICGYPYPSDFIKRLYDFIATESGTIDFKIKIYFPLSENPVISGGIYNKSDKVGDFSISLSLPPKEPNSAYFIYMVNITGKHCQFDRYWFERGNIAELQFELFKNHLQKKS
jgi:hypothetical protein